MAAYPSGRTNSESPLLYCNIVFPELEKELARNYQKWIRDQTRGYFYVRILRQKRLVAEWHIVLYGRDRAPDISQRAPSVDAAVSRVQLELEDRDLLKIITGGMNGIKAYTTKKLAIKGDLVLAQQAEKLFVKAGGVAKVIGYIQRHYPDFRVPSANSAKL